MPGVHKSINLTGNSRVLKRWAVRRPAGYFTVGFGSTVFFIDLAVELQVSIDRKIANLRIINAFFLNFTRQNLCL